MFSLRLKRHTRRSIVVLLIGLLGCLCLWGLPTSAKIPAPLRSAAQEAKQDQLSPSTLTTTMYGGNGGHNNSDSINDGSLVIIDQTNAATTLVGHPDGVSRLTGLAFDSTGALFASTISAGGFPPPPPALTSTLITISPVNGGLFSTIGVIKEGSSAGPAISIADLAVQPGTNVLFAVRAPTDGLGMPGRLYTIDKTTGVATLVGNTNAFFASIAFAPDGTLYESAADLNPGGPPLNPRLNKLNPATGAILSTVSTAQFYGALDVRPTDGKLFGGTGDEHQIFTINTTTGVGTLVGDTGQNFVGDIAFSPVVNAGINAYRQTYLVSDIPGVATILDSNLVNPWGVTFSASSPFWVSDNQTGVSTLYSGDVGGSPFTKVGLTVSIPGGSNTGVVFNGTNDFVITDSNGTGPARFIFDSEVGQVAAWRSGTSAISKVTTPNAVYKGLAIGNNGTANFLYAANFNSGKIDVFDSSFAPATLAGNFTDPTLPANYAPFNIQNLGGRLYVTYALQDANKKDDVAGPGNGFVDTFDTNGNFLGRLISNGVLNSPWGLVISPASFGLFGNALLVGNFGDGRINAFNPNNGALLGTITDQGGNQFQINGLWALVFGNGGSGGDPGTLYFSAGIEDEAHGLFGKLQAAAPAPTLIQFSSETYSVNEGDGAINVTVTRTGDLSQPATINFATVDQSAAQVTDYTAALGTLHFAGGEAGKTLSIAITDDVFVESDETFLVVLSNPTGAGLGQPNGAEVTIRDNDSGPPPVPVSTVRSGAGATPAAIQSQVDQFRIDLGNNNGIGNTFETGRREINWDGVPDNSSAPNNLPANFFNVNSPRGVVFSTPGDPAGTFQVSAKAVNPTSTPVRFGNLNANYPTIFSTFSPERLFTALSSTGNVVDVTFFIPGTNTPATVSGFGSVFTDVDILNSTKIQYFDSANALILEQSVPASAGSGSLSFLGVSFTNRRIARVSIVSGNSHIGPDDTAGNDVVVMDDFIYGEPQATAPISPKTFVGSLNGAQEVPPKTTNGLGTGTVILSADETTAKVSLSFSGLGTPANAAHIHGPAVPGVNALVLFPLSVPAATSGSVNDVTISLTPQQVQFLKDGLLYFNVQTTTNPGGEIRGQILSNPIEEPAFFVRQHYLDFLNRQPDAGGLGFWTDQITSCGTSIDCISSRRITVSASFFFSSEFQGSGFFVYRVRKAALGTQPTYGQYLVDRNQLASPSEADKTAFAQAFVQRGEFLAVYPTSLSGSAFIDRLLTTIQNNSGVDLTSKKPELINEYVLEVTQTASRARVIRKVIEYQEFIDAESNPAFVLFQYFGYLRRDADPGGYAFWLNVLNNKVPGNFRAMVCGFITSAEYQLRFGPNTPRNNGECGNVVPAAP